MAGPLPFTSGSVLNKVNFPNAIEYLIRFPLIIARLNGNILQQRLRVEKTSLKHFIVAQVKAIKYLQQRQDHCQALRMREARITTKDVNEMNDYL